MPNAVLVIDMLKGFLEEGNPLYCGPEARRIIPEVRQLIETELKKGSSVFFVADSHQPDDLEFQMFPPHCIRGTHESEVIEELSGYPGKRIEKQRYSAFYNTELDLELAALKPDKVIVCGVCTDICVLHTAADARNRDYPVEVATNCVASFDPSAHRWALEHMQKVLGVETSGEESR